MQGNKHQKEDNIEVLYVIRIVSCSVYHKRRPLFFSLERWIVIEDDRHHAHVAERTPRPAQNVLPTQPHLPRHIQSPVVDLRKW